MLDRPLSGRQPVVGNQRVEKHECFHCETKKKLNRPTASNLERVIHCPASNALPHIRGEVGEAAVKGTAIHRYLELVGKLGPEGALMEIEPEYHRDCMAINHSLLPTDPSKFMAEVALAYDYTTGKGRILGKSIGRQYVINDNELAGTADVLSWGDYVQIDDYKTGLGAITPPSKNAQLKFLALAACRALGISQAKVRYIRIVDGVVQEAKSYDMGPMELDEFASIVKGTMAQLQQETSHVFSGLTPDVYEGRWCKYCPAWESCPAKRDFLAALIGKGSQALADDDLAEIYYKCRTLESLAKKAMDRIKEHASENPIPLGDGLYYGEVNGRVREFRTQGGRE